MWLVDKTHAGLEAAREPIPPEIVHALLRWYTSTEAPGDEQTAVQLVQRAKLFDRWFACDCRGPSAAPALLSPAYLTEAETYYLRRLTGEGRPEHGVDCPFHRDQAEYRREAELRSPARVERPEGYFAVLKPIAEHLARKPDGTDESRPGERGPPRLARLLWTLLERAELDTIAPVGNRPHVSIQAEFGRLREAATTLEVAPGQTLDRLLFTHPDALRSRAIQSRLRSLERSWPYGHAPQAFLLTFARTVRGREVAVPDGEAVIVATDVKRAAGPVDELAPFLVLIAIGEHAGARGLIPVSAYAQPIFDGRRFLAVSGTIERRAVNLILRVQAWLAREKGVALIARRPLFDDAYSGPGRRPSFMFEIVDKATASVAGLALRVGETEHDTRCSPDELTLTGEELLDDRGAFRILARAIMRAVETASNVRSAQTGQAHSSGLSATTPSPV